MRNMRLSNLFMETWLARRARSRIQNVQPTDIDQEAGNESVSAFSTGYSPPLESIVK